MIITQETLRAARDDAFDALTATDPFTPEADSAITTLLTSLGVENATPAVPNLVIDEVAGELSTGGGICFFMGLVVGLVLAKADTVGGDPNAG